MSVTVCAPSPRSRAPRAARDGRRHGGDVGAAGDRELGHVVADSAARAGDEQAPPDERSGLAHESQGGQTGEREGGGGLDRHVVGQLRQRRRGHSGALRPAGLLGVTDDARAGCRPAAVGGGGEDDAGHIFARAPAGGWRAEQEGLAAVDRVRVDGNQRLVGGRRWFGRLAHVD